MYNKIIKHVLKIVRIGKTARRDWYGIIIVVAAAEEYGLRYHMPVKDVLSLFEQHQSKESEE